MTSTQRPVVCDRVRAQVSLALDGELSQLESRMLESHLARCPACAAFHADATEVTSALRSAPLEPLARPVVISRPRRISFARLHVAAAAAIAIAALGAASQLSTGENDPSFATPERYATTTQLSREVAQIIADGEAFADSRGDVMPL